tara:strand:+ start:287 stop:643 length:357 start_codon:yes stop_codon:yes gene_type:complete
MDQKIERFYLRFFVKEFFYYNINNKEYKNMIKSSLYFSLSLFLCMNFVNAQSNLLESVKKNPKNALEMCNKFKEFNKRGISASSDEVVSYVSKKNNLSPINAEILSIYVIGMHCPKII